MLIINEELLAIDQAIDNLVLHFLRLPEVENYRLKQQRFKNARELQELLLEFQELKESYDKAKGYEVLRMKRQIDLNEVVIGYRQAEFDLQIILASLGEEVAQAISNQIFIDTGLPLAPHKPHHKKGGTNIKEEMSRD